MPKPDKSPLTFKYTFQEVGSSPLSFEIELDPVSLSYRSRTNTDSPPWTDLEYHICDGCKLMGTGATKCPVAINFQDIVHEFKDAISYDKVDIIIETEERSYIKDQVPMQSGLSSILGLIMVTSGCPSMDYLRPMVKTHLPFATISETIYRAISMYLLGQFTRAKNGLEPDWTLAGLSDIYAQIDKINRSMVQRLQSATQQDASLNAVVILDSFAKMVPLTISGVVNDLDDLFWPYLEPGDSEDPKP